MVQLEETFPGPGLPLGPAIRLSGVAGDNHARESVGGSSGRVTPVCTCLLEKASMSTARAQPLLSVSLVSVAEGCFC